MPRLMPLFLRRSRFVARRRRGVGGGRRFHRTDDHRYGGSRYFGRRHGAEGYRERRHGVRVSRVPRRLNRGGVGPANAVAPADMAVPDWLLAGPAAPMLEAGNIDPALAAPPPPFWCPAHGWVVCPLHEFGRAVDAGAAGQSPSPVFEFGGTSSAAVDVADNTPRMPSPTPAVVEVEGYAPAYVSAPTGVRSFTNAVADSIVPVRLPSPTPAVADDASVAPPRLPSQTPATPPPSPRSGARRRLLALGLPAPSPPSSGRGRRAGTWSPAALGLANGVGPGTSLPDNSSGEDIRGQSSGRR